MDAAPAAEVVTAAIATAGVVVSGSQSLRRRLKARAARKLEVMRLVNEMMVLVEDLASREAQLESEVAYLVDEMIGLEDKLADLQAEVWKRTRRRRA